MAIFQISLPTHNLSSCRVLSGQYPISLPPIRTSLSAKTLLPPIRMGGGPRTFPGGVSKWQWKRMQAKKAKQLLKARLSRERQVYEMRKRAELKAAVAELERPWEVVQDCAPKTFSVSADEQLKVLADRFQRPGGFDMWSERDGPQLFSSVNGLPSARFFPKGVVHSTKPYTKIDENLSDVERLSLPSSFSELEDDIETYGYKSSARFRNSVSNENQIKDNRWIENTDGKFRNKPYKKIGRKSSVAEKLSLPSFISEVEDNIERNGYKKFDGVMNSIHIDPHIKASKWIKNSRNGNEKIGNNGKFRSNPSQIIGKNLKVAQSSSSPSSVHGVEDNITRNGYKKLDRFGDNLSNEGQTKANKWIKYPMDRNEKFGRNGKLRNKGLRNGYQDSDTYGNSSTIECRIRANQSSQNSTNRNEQSYSNCNIGNKGSSRRFQLEKSNTFKESRASSSEVYDMDLRDGGSYGFEAENYKD